MQETAWGAHRLKLETHQICGAGSHAMSSLTATGITKEDGPWQAGKLSAPLVNASVASASRSSSPWTRHRVVKGSRLMRFSREAFLCRGTVAVMEFRDDRHGL